MGLVTEVRLAHDELVLVPTIERHPEATIIYEYEVTTDEGRLCFVSVFGDGQDDLGAAMATDPTVSNPTRVASFANRTVYRVTVETDLEIVPDTCADHGVFVLKIRSDTSGWVARIHLQDRAALSVFRNCCRDRAVSFRVKELYEATPTDDGTYFLTERQHEILLMAYYAGYYEIPRSISQRHLAEHLGVSTSAVSQRLRRAVSDLIAATIDGDRTPAELE